MSRLVRNKPEIRILYEDTYRILRWSEIRTLPEFLNQAIAITCVPNSPMQKAKLSFNNRRTEFTGWTNPSLKREFENVKSGMPPDYDLPF